MHRTPLKLAAASAAAVATLGLGAGSAFAAGSSTTPSSGHTAPAHHSAKAGRTADAKLPQNATLAQIQAAAKTDIANRVTAANAAIAKLQKAKGLGTAQTALVQKLQADVTGLQQLGAKIAADTSAPAALADYHDIFTAYRVFALQLPVTRLVAADDRITTVAAPRLTRASQRIAARENPGDQAKVAPLLADVATEVKAATAAVAGQSSTLLGYTPAAWNADHHLLATPRNDTRTAVADLKKARTDAVEAARDAGIQRRSAHSGSGSTGSTTGSSSTPAATAS